MVGERDATTEAIAEVLNRALPAVADAEPSRPRCNAPGEHNAGREHGQALCDCAEPSRAEGDGAGGRPREADPQGPGNPIRTGGDSVDGGGDDGRGRAIEAMTLHAAGKWPKPPEDEDCADLLDAALASGHVRLTDPGEPDISVEAYWAVSEERDQAEARVRELEAALREIATGNVVTPRDMGNLAALQRRARAALEGDGGA